MQDFYKWLSENNFHWDRADKTHIWVALNGYKVFDEAYGALMLQAKEAKAFHLDSKYDQICGKTFYTFKHK